MDAPRSSISWPSTEHRRFKRRGLVRGRAEGRARRGAAHGASQAASCALRRAAPERARPHQRCGARAARPLDRAAPIRPNPRRGVKVKTSGSASLRVYFDSRAIVAAGCPSLDEEPWRARVRGGGCAARGLRHEALARYSRALCAAWCSARPLRSDRAGTRRSCSSIRRPSCGAVTTIAC